MIVEFIKKGLGILTKKVIDQKDVMRKGREATKVPKAARGEGT